MLTPDYLEHVPDRLVKLYTDTELRIIEDIARRISKTGYLTETGAWQLQKLAEMGSTYEYILDQLQRLTGERQGVVRGLLEAAAIQTLAYDDRIYRSAGLTPSSLTGNAQMRQIIDAGAKKTNGLFENLTRTTANTATKQFEHALDRAYTQVTSGAFDYQTALKTAIQSLIAIPLSIDSQSPAQNTINASILRRLLGQC